MRGGQARAQRAFRISHRMFPELRSYSMSVPRDASGREFGRYLAGVIRAAPEVTGYDLVLDFSEGFCDASQEDVAVIAEAYAEQRAGEGEPTFTFIVSPDPNFEFWTAALDFFFAGRTHRWVATVEEAWQRLEGLRGRERQSASVRALA